MSSDQQFNDQISGANDLRQNKQNDNQQFECSVDNIDNVIAANIVLDNDTVPNSGTEPSQCDKDHLESLKIIENHKLSTVEENVNFHTNEPAIALDVQISNEHNFQTIAQSDEKSEFVDEGEAVSCINNGNEEDVTLTLNNKVVVTPDDNVPNDTPPQTSSEETCNEKEIQILSSGAENVDIQPSLEQEKSNDTGDTDENKDILAPETESATVKNGNEIEPSDDVSNDENDNFSVEHDSNEDSSEFPDLVDCNGTNEVENEEYILDTVERKPRKERRRIVTLNDDSDHEFEVERERLLQSPTVQEPDLTDTENVEEDIDIELLIQNEKPGPKSKKVSTQKLKELQTRELLRNAVVIPSSSKKKKGRIIDSDDDEDHSLLPYVVDVDDIGMPDTNEYNDNETDVLLDSSILVNDIDNYPTSTENLNQNSSAEITSDEVHNKPHGITLMGETNDDNMPAISENPGCVKFSNESIQENQNQSLEVEPQSVDGTNTETSLICDSGNSSDSTNQQCKNENEINTATMNFPPFPSSSSSENEDAFIPNEVYFGTPDNNYKKSSRANRGRQRGRPAQTSSRETKTVQNVARSSEKRRGSTGRGRPQRRDKFIDNRRTSSTSGSNSTSSSSESDDEYQKSKARRKPETITIVKQPSQLYHRPAQKVSLPIRPIQKQQQIQRQNHRKRDRFYDKSQDIPNAIYFGDVDVPLHVLHAYGGSDSDNDTGVNSNVKNREAKLDLSKSGQIRFSSQVSRGRGRTITLPNQVHSNARQQQTMKTISDHRKARGRPKVTSVSPSNDQSIQMMKKFLKAAGLKKVKLNRLWEGCKSNSERADKMLELLREKGLEGEPTISKCKQLKVDFLTKKEIEDLDPNLIIQTEGRTRRSTRAATKRQYTYDEEEILETRTKLRKVIDSDSDFD